MTETETKLAEALHKILSISIGVYPKAVNGVDRTAWQEGWNAARKVYAREIIAIARNDPSVSIAIDIIDSLSPNPFESIQPKVLFTDKPNG